MLAPLLTVPLGGSSWLRLCPKPHGESAQGWEQIQGLLLDHSAALPSLPGLWGCIPGAWNLWPELLSAHRPC